MSVFGESFLGRDLHLGWRLAGRQPAQSALTVVALGLGIGLTATMFSVIHGIFLRPLPFPGADRLVQVDASRPKDGLGRMPLSPREVAALQAARPALSRVSAWSGVALILSGDGAPAERLNAAYVSADLFPLLGVQPALGRSFEPADARPGAAPVLLLGDEVWRRRYGASSAVVGRAVRLQGSDATIVGVMPPGFEFPLSQELWVPLIPDPSAVDERWAGLQAVGLLRPGVSRQQAQAELAGLAAGLAAEYPAAEGGLRLRYRGYVEAYSDPEMRSYLLALLGAVGGVLLVACATAANLLLGRAALRRREIAVRRALGAGRGRLVAQLLAEALVLAGLGGALGLILAAAGADLLHRIVKPILRSFWIDLHVDVQVVAFAVAVTAVATLLSSLAPALRGSTVDLVTALKGGDRSGLRPGRLGWALVVAQVALAGGLLAATGLMLRSVVRLDEVDPGFETAHLLTGGLSIPASYRGEDGAQRFAQALEERLAALPGAGAVALSSSQPGGGALELPVEVEGVPASPGATVRTVIASPGYFAAFDIRPEQGRILATTDGPAAPPVALVDRAFARRQLGAGRDPLQAVGRRIRIALAEAPGEWRTVVGVVPDPPAPQGPERQRGFLPLFAGTPAPADPGEVYLPLAQAPRRSLSLAIRARGPVAPLAAAVRREVTALDPDLPPPALATVAESLREESWDYRLFSVVLTVFGTVALTLAALGLYGLMVLLVTARRQELGVRAALGARPADILRQVLAGGLAPLALGLALGLGLAAVLSRTLSTLLFKIAPWDAATFAAVAAVLAVTGLVACLLPARRAARIDPLAALRTAGS